LSYYFDNEDRGSPIMSVISLRLKDGEIKRINELSRMEHKDKSTVARELIDYGWECSR